MKYIKGWDNNGLIKEFHRLGNELAHKVIDDNVVKAWDTRDWWKKPEWKPNTLNNAKQLISPTKEMDDYFLPQIERFKNLVVVQVRWGNHEPGNIDHFPTNAEKFMEMLDIVLPRWKDSQVYLASDSIIRAKRFFSDFNILTSQTIDRPIEYDAIVDYWMMANCNKLLCSNSSLSWTASLINEKCDFFVRPNEENKLVVFEPWNSAPCVMLKEEFVEQNKKDFKLQVI